jgi:hypothetical protein
MTNFPMCLFLAVLGFLLGFLPHALAVLGGWRSRAYPQGRHVALGRQEGCREVPVNAQDRQESTHGRIGCLGGLA